MKFKFTEQDIHVLKTLLDQYESTIDDLYYQRQIFTDKQYNDTINHVYVLQIKLEDIYKEIIKNKK